MKMRSWFALSLILSCVLFSGCRSSILDDSVPRERIFSYVLSHRDLLEAFPSDRDHMELMDSDWIKVSIKQYLGKSSIVKDVYRYSEDVLGFYCGGTGLLTASAYMGFYYSAQDEPYGLEFRGNPLTETSPGVFEWHSDDDSESIVTERICDHWFYYYMKWY